LQIGTVLPQWTLKHVRSNPLKERKPQPSDSRRYSLDPTFEMLYGGGNTSKSIQRNAYDQREGGEAE
jgi:hypothetical protein